MSKWKLYWVTVERSQDENCFIVAKNKRSAAALEERRSGFDPYDAQAKFVMNLPPMMENKIERDLRYEMSDDAPAWPNYAGRDLLSKLGASFFLHNGHEATKIEGKIYEIYNQIEIMRPRDWVLINNVAAYEWEIYREKDRSSRIYRGQADATWEL